MKLKNSNVIILIIEAAQNLAQKAQMKEALPIKSP